MARNAIQLASAPRLISLDNTSMKQSGYLRYPCVKRCKDDPSAEPGDKSLAEREEYMRQQ
jgi:hypothetical protein